MKSCNTMLTVLNIVKVFPGGIKALDNVSLDIRCGEIQALLGENGAGKSTLAKIIAGYLLPDKGEIRVYGRKVTFRGPHDALKHGIFYVQQYPQLVESLSVAENAALLLNEDPHTAYKKVKEYFGVVSLNIEGSTPIYSIPLGLRQRLALAFALALGAKLLILDEPTIVLSSKEIEKLAKTLRELVSEGLSILYITHRLNEVYIVADRATILRRGKVVARLDDPRKVSREQLASLMVGEPIGKFKRPFRTKLRSEKPYLVIENLTAENDYGVVALRNVNLIVHSGEIVGVAGVEGNGQRELVECIVGLRKPKSGRVVVGKKIIRSPRDFRDVGGAFIPEDRFSMLAPPLTVCENLIIEKFFWDKVSAKMFGKHVCKHTMILNALKKYNVKGGPLQPLYSLSGGNQQKILLIRELEKTPKLVIAYRPSTSLDVLSTQMLINTLVELREKNAAILYVADDLEELLAVSDRIVVINRGRIVASLDAEKTSVNEIAKYMVL
ncbi:MAG TPA: ATP-binding cassette domain-containing protein [Pyrodictium sp.]|nr:ATP-binding cassette domain-containing protein [Pyrodictium sp.]HIQ56166.1 ATP-binding cassette domain-containing protein [Pyrodictium sp.]